MGYTCVCPQVNAFAAKMHALVDEGARAKASSECGGGVQGGASEKGCFAC